MLNKLYGEKAVHVKAYEYNFKPKQQEYAVSSIGVKEDSPLCMFATKGFCPGRYKVRKEPSPAKRCKKSGKDAKRVVLWKKNRL